jgi:hypothetical protein
MPKDLTLRYATPGDAAALERLAALDSSRPLGGRVLLAEVEDDVVAAISLADHRAVSDPFQPTGELVWILAERARQLQRADRPRGRRRFRRRLRPATA